jgi:hypothetical protein
MASHFYFECRGCGCVRGVRYLDRRLFRYQNHQCFWCGFMQHVDWLSDAEEPAVAVGPNPAGWEQLDMDMTPFVNGDKSY